MLGEQRSDVALETARVERELTELSAKLRPRRRSARPRSGSSPSASSSGWRSCACSISGARILVFDEPTAVLTPQEAQSLIRTLRGLAAQGFCVIFISHKLDEVLEVADRISILRRGKMVATTTPAETDRRTLARLMVGRELAEFVEELDGRAPRDGSRRQRPDGPRAARRHAPWARRDCRRCGSRSRGPRRRDARHRRRRRQRTARAGRSRHRPASRHRRHDRRRRQGR